MKPAAFRSNRPAKPPSSALHPGERKPLLPLHSFFSSFLSIFYHENEVTSSGGRLGQRLDHVHQLVTGGDVHPTVLIGQPSVRDTVTVSLSTARLTEAALKVCYCFLKHVEFDDLPSNLKKN